MYNGLSAQHHFPYYQIHSTDIIQEPHWLPTIALIAGLTNDSGYAIDRFSLPAWFGQGLGGLVDSFYGQQGVFDERLHFGLGQGKGQEVRKAEDLQAIAFTNGPLALTNSKGVAARVCTPMAQVEDGRCWRLCLKTWDPHPGVDLGNNSGAETRTVMPGGADSV